MSKTKKTDPSFPASVGDMTIAQLMTIVDRRVAGGEIPWPLRAGPFPFPWPCPTPPPGVGPFPLPPYCPNCGTTFGGTATEGRAVQGVGPAARATAPRSVSYRAILDELIAALQAWKVRFATVTKDTRLDDMTASGDGRFDVLSAVARSRFFQDLWLDLRYMHIGADETLADVAESIARLLEDAGHGVTP